MEMSEGEKFIWCLVANVVGSARDAGGVADDGGTKHFSPGTKLFCFPYPTGDRIRVLGRHRGGGPRLIEMVVSKKDLTNWRAQKVFRPDVLALMIDAWDDSESSRLRAERIAGVNIGATPEAATD